MKSLTALMLLISFIFCSTAYGDVRVKPDPRQSGISLNALKYKPHHSSHRSAHTHSASNGSNQFQPSSSNPLDPDSWLEPERTQRGNDKNSPVCSKLLNGKFRCKNPDVEKEPADKKKATKKLSPGQILSAVREVGLPSVKIDIQPGGATLVNFDTIFYASPHDVHRTIELLGFQIEILATPAHYRWHHGDGTTQITDKPGRPYPHKDITHRYQSTATNVHPSVDIAYSIRYRVDGRSWQSLDTPVTASGPTTDLQVKEATALLTAS